MHARAISYIAVVSSVAAPLLIHPGLAIASPDEADAGKAARTRTFSVLNDVDRMTPFRMVYKGLTSDEENPQVVEGPRVGDILEPGQKHTFVLRNSGEKAKISVQPLYDFPNGARPYIHFSTTLLATKIGDCSTRQTNAGIGCVPNSPMAGATRFFAQHPDGRQLSTSPGY